MQQDGRKTGNRMAFQAGLLIAVNSVGAKGAANGAETSVSVGALAAAGAGASDDGSVFAKLLGKKTKGAAQAQGLVAPAPAMAGMQAVPAQGPQNARPAKADAPMLLNTQPAIQGASLPSAAALLTPGVQTGPVPASKTTITPGLLQTPGVQTGPVLAGTPGKGAVQPGALQTPGVQTEPVPIGKTTITPGLLQTPGIQTGPVLAGTPGKGTVQPGALQMPGFQTEPVPIGKTTITPGPLQTPGIQTGPILAGKPGKGAVQPGPLQTPGVQTGPVQAGKTSTATASQHAQTGPEQSESPDPHTQTRFAQRQIRASAPHSTAKAAALVAQAAGSPGQSDVAGTFALPETPAKPGKPEGKAFAHTRKRAGTGHGKAAAAAAARPSANTPASPAAHRSAAPLAAQSPDQVRLAGLQDTAEPDRLVQGSTPRGGEAPLQAQDSKSAAVHLAQAEAAPRAANAHAATPAAQSTSHHAPRLDPAALETFAASLVHRARNGASTFTMRLDPPELGKVHIRLDVSADHRIEAIVSTHRPDVLADLQRGADSLRRALVDAGFDPGADGLSFSLDRGPQGHDASPQDAFGPRARTIAAQDGTTEDAGAPLLAAERGYGLMRVFGGGVDISI